MLALRIFGYNLEIRWSILIWALFVIDTFPAAGIVIWLTVAATTILIHELGHAIATDRMGGSVEKIVLYGMGGLTYSRNVKQGWPRFAVSLAGSAIQIILGIITFGIIRAGIPPGAAMYTSQPWSVDLISPLVAGNYIVFASLAFMWISVFWGTFNLLPLGGLDGSSMLAEAINKIIPGKGRFHATIIGLLVSGVVGYLMYLRGSTLIPIILFYFALISLSNLRQR